MARPLRVAFFTDTFHEVNGVALTSRQWDSFARRRGLPFLSVHAGPETTERRDGPVWTLELGRSAAKWNLEATSELAFDPLIARNRTRVAAAMHEFSPDLVHVTSPGDIGMLGAWLAHKAKIPMFASWHTNVHEYAAERLRKLLSFLPAGPLDAVSAAAEKHSLTGAALFYRIARALFAPNQELVEMLRAKTGKPVHLMQRGIDTEMFTPARRDVGAHPFTIGYVGRISVEKNVRFLVEVDAALRAAGRDDFQMLVIGSGGEEPWLRARLEGAVFPGVLKGEALARAYASMDVFAFPSQTDTFGNVVLEAQASGVPPVVTGGGGPKYLVEDGTTGFVARDDAAFIASVLRLYDDRPLQRRMAAAARQHASTYAWDAVFERVYAVYAASLSAGAGA